jgi:hypothetical protein
MVDSVNITQLVDWLEGRLTAEEEQAVAVAVQSNETLQTTVAWLRSFLDLSQATILMEPPGELLLGTTATFREYAGGKRPAGWLKRLTATLTSDSWQRSVLTGTRRTGLNAAPRQLVYRADFIDIVLNTRADAKTGQLDLLGQVFPHHEANLISFTIQLLQQERESALTYTDALGKFTCTELEAGVYTLIARGDRVEMILDDVELSV